LPAFARYATDRLYNDPTESLKRSAPVRSVFPHAGAHQRSRL
jgi:hypothetical protein